MCRFAKNFLKVALGLTSATVLVLALQAQAAASAAMKSGAFLLAQSTESQKEQQKSYVEASTQKDEKLKQEKSREQKIQPEKQAPKTRSIKPPPAGGGTKKFGGGVIRDKGSPEGE